MSDPGLSFGAAAAAYERGRPEWPEALLDELPVAADAEVLDLGAGTGKFHWFDPDAAVGEIARVLRPGGVLALLWNRFERGAHVLPDDVQPPSRTPKHHLFSTGEWRRAFEGGPFERLREATLEQERVVPRAELLDYSRRSARSRRCRAPSGRGGWSGWRLRSPSRATRAAGRRRRTGRGYAQGDERPAFIAALCSRLAAW